MATLPRLLLCFGTILLRATASLDPPQGNSKDLIVRTKGVQIYQCTNSDGHLAWSLQRAEAKLYDHENSTNPSGFHYFLPRPDAGGGKPTWAIQAQGCENPTSTVTGKVIARKSGGAGNVDLLLLQATSHSGHGELSNAAYIQRAASRGGAAPNAGSCIVPGLTRVVPYESHYVFWTQQKSPASPDNDEISQGNLPQFVFFAEGFQHYTYNGSGWNLKDATALLSSIPGQEVVGRHYYLPEKDAKGGQPTWETFNPPSSVTGKPVKATKVAADSIPWVDLEATSNTGKNFFSSVTLVQRRSTRGGLAPSASEIPTPGLGFEHQSPYTAVYWFYVPN